MHSLENAVRVVPGLMPSLSGALSVARDRVAPWIDLEAFVFADSTPQAWCAHEPGSSRALVGLTSGLVELLEGSELRFVIGHEVGHALFGHVGFDESSIHSKRLPIAALRALSRAAEISADRVGRIASGNITASVGAMLKVASGLSSDHLRLDVGAFLDQLSELHEVGRTTAHTHPVFGLRCRALLWFEQSAWATGDPARSGSALRPLEDIDRRIERELSASLGFGQAHSQQKAIQSAVLWGALSLFMLDGKLERSEQELLSRFCGERSARKAIQLLRAAGPAAVLRKVDPALAHAGSLPYEERAALYDDLEAISSCAGCEERDRLSLLEHFRILLHLGRR